MSQPVLQCRRLTKDYGTFRALDGLDLEIPAGEIFGLLGPNGSGKSTALRMLLGFLRPTMGDAWIVGRHCWRESVSARRNVAYLPGELRLYETMTGRQIVKFLARLRGQNHDAEVARLAERFEIDLDRPLVNLSSGMKRKVALLSVLAPQVPLLVLDEPTNTLDPTMRDELFAQIRLAKQRGQTVLFSSHVLTEVESVCDRVGILQRGKLVHLGSISDVQKDRVVRIAFRREPAAWPELDGVDTPKTWGTRVSIRQTGPPAALFAWLATQDVEEVHIEAGGLAPIYHSFHGSDS